MIHRFKALTQQVIHDSLQLTQHFRLGLDYPARYTGVGAPFPALTQRSPVPRVGAARRQSDRYHMSSYF